MLGLRALVDTSRLGSVDALHCRSRRKLFSESASALVAAPAAVLQAETED